MRIITAGPHRILDFVTVIAFLLAPVIFGLTGAAATLAYALAAVHLALTLLTRFVPDGRGIVPFRAHGVIELLVGILLVLFPFLLGWQGTARTFYVLAGIVILVVWALTTYDEHRAHIAA